MAATWCGCLSRSATCWSALVTATACLRELATVEAGGKVRPGDHRAEQPDQAEDDDQDDKHAHGVPSVEMTGAGTGEPGPEAPPTAISIAATSASTTTGSAVSAVAIHFS